MSYEFLFSTSKLHLQDVFNFQAFTTWTLGSYKYTRVNAFYNVLLRIFVNAKLKNKILVPV
jgi:hypothetical protein